MQKYYIEFVEYYKKNPRAIDAYQPTNITCYYYYDVF